MPDIPTRLFLVTAPVGDAGAARPGIEAALGAGDVACLLLRLAPAAAAGTARALAPAGQGRGTALLTEEAGPAAEAGADGVHLRFARGDFAAVMDRLKPGRPRPRDEEAPDGEDPPEDEAPDERPGGRDGYAASEPIAGAGALGSRDDAMRAGEAGVDYVMFGDAGFAAAGPAAEAVLDAVGWWAALFNVPCVGFARALSEVGPLAAAGAEFVALGAAVWDDPRGPAAAVAEAQAALEAAARQGAEAGA